MSIEYNVNSHILNNIKQIYKNQTYSRKFFVPKDHFEQLILLVFIVSIIDCKMDIIPISSLVGNKLTDTPGYALSSLSYHFFFFSFN